MNLAAATSTNVPEHVFWLASRAAGVVAVAMMTLSVILGLIQGGRLPLGIKARDLTRIHEFASLATIVAILAHGALLLADPWLKPTFGQILVPFTLDFKSFYTGLGIVGAWVAVILGLSYYARDHIGIKRWKTLHRFTIVAYALSVVHVFGAGTDAQATWLKAPLLASVGVVTALFVLRVSSTRKLSRPAPRPAQPAAPVQSRATPPVPRPPAHPARRSAQAAP